MGEQKKTGRVFYDAAGLTPVMGDKEGSNSGSSEKTSVGQRGAPEQRLPTRGILGQAERPSSRIHAMRGQSMLQWIPGFC